MAIQQMILGATRKSAPASAVEKRVKSWVWKNAFTQKNKDVDVDYSFLTLEEWRDHMWTYVHFKATNKRCAFTLPSFRRVIEDAIGVDYNDERDDRIHKVTKWMEKLVEPLGWYVGGWSGNTTIFVDPLQQPQVTGLTKIYHFSPWFNKDSILRKGLIPQGTDSKYGQPKYGDDYKYPPRTHLLTKYDLDVMRELAYHIFNHGDDIEKMYRGGAGMNMPLVVFEIDVSKCRPGTKFYEDVSVKKGVFTYTHIPAQALKVKYEDAAPEDDA